MKKQKKPSSRRIEQKSRVNLREGSSKETNGVEPTMEVENVRFLLQTVSSQAECERELAKLGRQTNFRGATPRLENLYSGRARRLENLGILHDFVQMRARLYGGNGHWNFTANEIKEFDFELRFIHGTNNEHEIPKHLREEFRNLIGEIKPWRIEVALEGTFREVSDDADPAETFLEKLREQHKEQQQFFEKKQLVSPQAPTKPVGELLSVDDEKTKRAGKNLPPSTLKTQKRVKCSVYEFCQVFPDQKRIPSDVFVRFTQLVEEGVITPRKIRFVARMADSLKKTKPGKRLFANPNAFIREFNMLFGMAADRYPSEAEKLVWSREQVVALINVYKNAVVGAYDLNEDHTLRFYKGISHRVWLEMVILVQHKKADIRSMVFGDQELYRKLRDEIRANPEIFRILRDDLKMVDLAKLLNEPIDHE